jgi:hypothetical protein
MKPSSLPIIPVLILLVMEILGIGGFVLLHGWVWAFSLPWPALGLACAFSSGVMVKLRLDSMKQAPVAFPAGRLG